MTKAARPGHRGETVRDDGSDGGLTAHRLAVPCHVHDGLPIVTNHIPHE